MTQTVDDPGSSEAPGRRQHVDAFYETGFTGSVFADKEMTTGPKLDFREFYVAKVSSFETGQQGSDPGAAISHAR